MPAARPVGPGFSPLDEELGLIPGQLTPRAEEQLVRLGTWIPSFAQAAELLGALVGVWVSEATVRRHTEAAGAVQVRLQERAVEALKAGGEAEPHGAARMVMSADGAMVPLRHGEWGEAKTLVVGEVAAEQDAPRKTQHLSYFSRLAEAERFKWQALVETHRRGLATAGAVASVSDGAEWIQGLVDFHRPDAVRILDLPHVAEHLNAVGQGLYGENSPQARAWLEEQVAQLKAEGPEPVLARLRDVAPGVPEGATHLGYLAKRAAQLDYPAFMAAGWPIGSGMVESANKLVVEDRLKGSGMHWERGHVDPMLALRNVVANDRWDEAWAQIEAAMRREAWEARRARQQDTSEARPESPSGEGVTAVGTVAAPPPPPATMAAPRGTSHPAANHPWRHAPLGKARYQPWRPYDPPKT